MARYCIAFETMKSFHNIKSDASLKDLVRLVEIAFGAIIDIWSVSIYIHIMHINTSAPHL